jgi:hypothetical protein
MIVIILPIVLLMVLLIIMIPGKSGDDLMDKILDWCRRYLPW